MHLFMWDSILLKRQIACILELSQAVEVFGLRVHDGSYFVFM